MATDLHRRHALAALAGLGACVLAPGAAFATAGGRVQLRAQHGMHLLRLFGRGGLAGADGPHRLVGDHDLAGAVGHHMDDGGQLCQWQWLLDVGSHDFGGLGQVLVAGANAFGLWNALAVVAGALGEGGAPGAGHRHVVRAHLTG